MISIDCRDALEKYGHTVFRLIFSHTGHRQDAEDVFQEVFFKAAKKGFFESDEHLKAWLIRAAIHGSISSLRKKRELPLIEEILGTEERQELRLDILTAIRQLEPRSRSVVFLYYYEGYRLEEIAAMLKINHSTLRSLHLRAKQKLRMLLGEEK